MRPFLAPIPSRPITRGSVPTFSIIIAAYQAAGFIGTAVESALAQTLAPLEVIVCDDGSTDDLDDALALYRDRLVLVRQENRGEGAAKNAAARMASGDFIAMLDADDVYLPNRLEALGELASARPDLDILVTDAFIESEGRVVRRAYDESWTFEVDDQRCAILERCFILGHAAVRRERFFAVGGFDDAMRTVADWDLWIRIILGGSRAGLIPEPLARYRVREGSLSTDTGAMLEGRIHCLERALERDDLSADERITARSSLTERGYELRLFEAREALLTGSPGVRRRLLTIALGRGFGLRTRLKAALSAIFPSRAGAAIARRESAAWVGAAGVRVEREEPVSDRAD
jgi:glycosyltransferase involved in cell wall biosynthesis